ncbi:hypothetical protein B4U80_00050 [Leptotrombidium deliense]|uniref:Uncharacterized protein n=1 Tax=Leptotrombidium deliense TaxID=299467 RepID=A0A443SQM6_9ACAR|nr:hypothetical protein B4U80_00050 [Leptotrombidium deliense]
MMRRNRSLKKRKDCE